MATKTVTDEQMDARAAEFDPPIPTEKVRKPKGPSMKRPENISDVEWAIMRAAKNEDVPSRILAVFNGDADVSADEAAVLLEIAMGAERQALNEIVKLRKQLAPKIAAARKLATDLGVLRASMFDLATAV